MIIKKDNIVRSATLEDAILLNKWWNDGKVMKDEDINSRFPIDRIIWDKMLESKRAQYVYELKIKARK